MKNITLFPLATVIFTACTTPFESFGEFSRKQLQNSEHNSWFMDNYDAHPLNETLVSQIDSLFSEIEVTIYMGTWCKDSQREVPGFFRIIDALDANDQINRLVGLNEDKIVMMEVLKKQVLPMFLRLSFQKKGRKSIGLLSFRSFLLSKTSSTFYKTKAISTHTIFRHGIAKNS